MAHTLEDIKARLDSMFSKLPSMGAVTQSEIEDELLNITIDGYPFSITASIREVKSIVGIREVPTFDLYITDIVPATRWNPAEDVDRELGQHDNAACLAEKMIHLLMSEQLMNISEMVEDELNPECPECGGDPYYVNPNPRKDECPTCEC